MIPRRSGKIVCMASIMSVIVQAGHSPYIASKGGISQFVKAIALEAAPYNVNVNAIGPTFIKSDLVDVTLQDPEKRKEILAKLPLGRAGGPGGRVHLPGLRGLELHHRPSPDDRRRTYHPTNPTKPTSKRKNQYG
jgi:NAD(P)-dependent dehydrogenase (short-subunit alcohol dehydrogenase family)